MKNITNPSFSRLSRFSARRRMRALNSLGAGRRAGLWSRIKPSRFQLGSVLLLAMSSGIACAQLKFTPYAASGVKYNSNVFDLSSRQEALNLTGSTARSDKFLENLVGFNADYQLSRQHFHFNAEGRRFNYDRFTALDHNEYLLDGGLDWNLASALNGTLNFKQERRMESFAYLQSTELQLERERTINGTANLLVTPEWRLEAGAKTHKLASPLPGFPQFALSENTGSFGFKYLGYDKLATGLTLEYLSGKYTGVPDATSFHQASLLSETDYAISGLSSLHLNLGYTRRNSGLNADGNSNAFVGSLGWTRQLTGKTSVNVTIFRRVDSFVSGANAVVNTGGTAGVTWNATDKVKVDAIYAYTNSKFQGQGTPGTLTTGRRDRYQYTRLEVNYQVLRWLAIRPSAEYEDRHSNLALAGYNSALLNLELRASF